MDWLIYYYNKKVIRLNINRLIKNLEINKDKNGMSDFCFKVDGVKISLEQIEAVWFRTGKLTFDKLQKSCAVKEFDFKINKYLFNEQRRIVEYIGYLLKAKRHIGQYFCPEPNKLIVIDLAEKIGLSTPKTVIMDSGRKINKLLNSFSRVRFITKAVSNPFSEIYQNKQYFSFTKEIKKGMVDKDNLRIFPTMIQELIVKQYEVRVFFFDDKFYSAAIFSQSEKSHVDFRKEMKEKNTRTVPYLLPNDIQIKLRKLIQELGYNSCSVDLIKSLEGEYYFLEVNPNGQFGFISKACNYNLEKKIARFLA